MQTSFVIAKLSGDAKPAQNFKICLFELGGALLDQTRKRDWSGAGRAMGRERLGEGCGCPCIVQDRTLGDYLAVGARKSPIKLGPTCPAMTVLDFGTIESIIAPTAEPTNRDDGASPFTADRSGFTFSNVGAGR